MDFKKKLLSLTSFLAVLMAGLVVAPGAAHAVDEGEFFIRNDYVEVGGRPNGTFGSDGAQPDGTWHSNDGDDRIGFRADREKDGWGVGIDDGDFFVPGGPYEGWGLQVADNDPLYNNDDVTALEGTTTQVDDLTATWESSSDVDGINILQTYSVPDDGGQYLNIEVTLENTTGDALDVYYGRGVDPDNCKYREEDVEWEGAMSTCAGSYDTLNSVVSQGVDGDDASIVSATTDDGSYIDLRTTEPTSVVGSDPSWDYGAMGEWAIPLADLYAVPTTYTEDAPYEDEVVNAVGESQFVDGVVYLVVKKSIPAGESVTFTVQYVLSQTAAEEISGGGDSCERCTGAGGHGGGSSGGGGGSTPGTTPATDPGSTDTPDTASGERPLVPGTDQPVAPIPTSGGVLPEVAPGQSLTTENGVPIPVTITPNASATGFVMTGDGFTFAMEIPASNGEAGSASGVVTITRSREVEVSGDGFAPGTLVDVWLFSTPTYLGTARVGADGRFTESMNVPASIAVGGHTLQANGTTADGKSRSLNLGVQVVDSNFTLPKTGGNDTVALVALWLLAAGVFVVTARRRRVIG